MAARGMRRISRSRHWRAGAPGQSGPYPASQPDGEIESKKKRKKARSAARASRSDHPAADQPRAPQRPVALGPRHRLPHLRFSDRGMCTGGVHRAGVERTIGELAVIRGFEDAGIAPAAGRRDLPTPPQGRIHRKGSRSAKAVDPTRLRAQTASSAHHSNDIMPDVRHPS